MGNLRSLSILIGSAIVTISTMGFAQVGNIDMNAVAAVPDATCSLTNHQDIFETPLRYTQSSRVYAGRCIDTNKFRPGKIRSETAQVIKVANYIHNNEYWTAEIPVDAQAWSKVYFHIVRFPVVRGVIAAHTQMRFVAANPHGIRLVSQRDSSRTITVGDLIYSVEAALPPPPEHYNFALGVFNNYAIVGRLTSGLQRTQEHSSNVTEQYNLAIGRADIANLVKSSIHRSEAMGMNHFYNTLRPNCTTEAFDILDQLPQLRGHTRPFYTVLWVDPIAGPSLAGLRERHLLGARGPDLGAELLHGETRAPVAAAPAETLMGVVRELPGSPYALVTIVPRMNNSQQVSNAVFSRLKTVLSSSTPRLAEAALTAGILGRNVSSILAAVIGQVQSDIRTFIREVNTQLPDEPVQVVMYLVPWDANTPRMNLSDQHIPADLPFNGATFSQTDSVQTNALLERVMNKVWGLHVYSQSRLGTSPVYFLGAAIRLQLQRNQSEQMVQIALGWNQHDLPFQTYSDQLVFDRVHLPVPAVFRPEYRNDLDVYTNQLGAVLITHKQRQYQNISPRIHFDFGALGRINSAIGYRTMGLFNVETYLLERALPFIGACVDHEKAVPELRGHMLAHPTGYAFLDQHLNNKGIALGFYKFDVVYAEALCRNSQQFARDEEQMRLCALAESSQNGVLLDNVDVRARMQLNNNFSIGCVRANMITQQFTTEANASIDMQIGAFVRSQQQHLLDVLTTGTN